jgi:UbiA prenyltransferase family
MKFLKNAFDFYIQSSIHVAFAVYCLLKITVFSNQLPSMHYFSITVFFGTILGYNFLKYYAVFRRGFFRSNRYSAILIVSLLAGIGFLFSFWHLNLSIQKLLIVSGVFVLLYSLLRKYGWLKLFLVSFTVTFITVYIPFQSQKWLSSEFYISFVQRFLWLTSLLIPFEIMDTKTDETSLNTLPQLFGIEKVKLFGVLLIIPFVIFEFLKLHPSYLAIPMSLVTFFAILFTDFKRTKYYTSFWVESVPIFWWLILVLFK